eukprot:2153774-Amphidinium_carterae.1
MIVLAVHPSFAAASRTPTSQWQRCSVLGVPSLRLHELRLGEERLVQARKDWYLNAAHGGA